MNESIHVAVIFYSATGNILKLARVVAEGAQQAGAEVRLRRVRELAPRAVIERNPQWLATTAAMRDVPAATHDDLDWSDVVVFGSPTRYGMIAAQLKEFIDGTGPLWKAGKLADKVYSAFTSAATAHGGHETTLLSLAAVFHHWGGIIVPPGYTDPVQFRAGNPYGTSSLSSDGPGDVEQEAARYQARRAVAVAQALQVGRRALEPVITRQS